jgi:hypothetical protein
MVHLTTTDHLIEAGKNPDAEEQQHFCEQCAHDYFGSTPGMGGLRGLICLSDSYRSRLYDQLEVAHPEAFQDDDCKDPTWMVRTGNTVITFLREQLKKERVEVSDEVFEMLYCDFIGSHHFYTRRDEFKRRKG